MRVTIDLEDALLQPLLVAHLEKGTPVKKQIAEAVSFYLKCLAAIDKDKVIVSGTTSGSYINNWQVLLRRED